MAFGGFIHSSDSIYQDIPSEQYQLPTLYLSRAQNCEVIIYDKRREVTDKKKLIWWEIWNASLERVGLPSLDHTNASQMHARLSKVFGTRTQLTRLRRKISDSLRDLHNGVAQFGRALDEQDRRQTKWLSTVHRATDEMTSKVRRYIDRLADRRTKPHHAGRELADQFEASESRRNSAARELDEQLIEKDRDYGFHL